MQKFGVGQPVRRKEDVRFITGVGQYVDDIVLPNQAHCLILRSPHAHARILGIDTSTAENADGVLGIITGADFEEAGYGRFTCELPLKQRDGSDIAKTELPLIALDRVRYVGEPVAAIIADSVEQARAAMDDIMIDYDPLDAVASIAEAQAADAPQLWPTAPGNATCYWETGDKDKTDQAFAGAAHTVRLELDQNRLVSSPMETRCASADYDSATDQYTLYASCQGAHNIQRSICHFFMHLDFDKLRGICPDVGGGFGMKGAVFPEYIVVLHAAKLVGRPVKWVGDRSEAFLADSHSRDTKTTGELALDDDGKILAIRMHSLSNLGAFQTSFGPIIATLAQGRWIGSAYQIPTGHAVVEGFVTNTAPIDAYRGAGRPEAAYLTERLVDAAAREVGLDQAEIRRRNFVTPDMMPWTGWNGLEVHSVDFDRNLSDALELADWQGFSERKQTSMANGKRRGIGLAYYLETAAAGVESGKVEFSEKGEARVFVGTQANGQGHETAFAQVMADQLGLPFDDIEIVQGDTALLARGGGTGGSRSAQMGSGVVIEVAAKVIEKGKPIAAQMMQSQPQAVDFEVVDQEGRFFVAGTQSAVGIGEVLRQSFDGSQSELDSDAVYKAKSGSIPNGCHICEVEIDQETGKVDVVGYFVVDDFGTLINPHIVEGQAQGGVAQGIGQALLEECVYEPGTAQLVTGSFTDYAMPRADDVPHMAMSFNEIKCASNPLGVKGCGEAGTTGALPATVNAVVDALADLGVRSLQMPATPERVWRLMQEGLRA